ncbi:SUMO-targeted ubiquitin-protein ligase subunit Rfp2 [Schizosaccharomyces cryophilus OY26]|uniref:SUMO-targeted ubiquitin-protein ligase subunit Rfp2 n=1 Tax=Schizosaccharomyces cryophilus (strain OY26 / ATCC MYA-4695 / CBS 11777 / NBRC 106824 / NRRL Y48691) TaxID=653667 RepID=S9X7E5_SCHCR|nr:SUMO-targeted ubiquitin-protein ligase subunit Rfp2 [Schizosaccharomyces cryophilus OY26]EPY49696.1 SUMO-targeted ubiquitin-protein ligase subunit Rfp2 [Schizosaccharomyces cryophilus OY26]
MNLQGLQLPGREHALSPEVIDLTEEIHDPIADEEVSEVPFLDLTRISEHRPRRRRRFESDVANEETPSMRSIPDPVSRPPISVGGGIFWTRQRRRGSLQRLINHSSAKTQPQSAKPVPASGFTYDVKPDMHLVCIQCKTELVNNGTTSIFASKCGHVFCSSCTKGLRKKTQPCPVTHCGKRLTRRSLFPLYI